MTAVAGFWYLWMPMLANIAGGLSGEFVTGLVVAVIGAVGSLFAYKKGQTGSTDASGSLRVTMEDQFVTRREFTDFKAEVRSDVVEMKGLFAQTMQKLDIQNTNLTNEIKAMGTGAYQGRHKLWEQVNEQRERVSRLEERTGTPKTERI